MEGMGLLMSKHSSNNKKSIKIILIIILLILILAGILIYKILQDNQNNQENNVNTEEENVNILSIEPQEEEEVQIYTGTERPIAVMIDNHNGAWPQAGLNKAYLVYEIIVEGGETRLMALFKGQDIENIGPVRSSRHYFLDYAMENDAIYVHYGWSPQAESDISTFSINNINGLNYNYSSSTFWRISSKNSPHNVMTSTTAIKQMAEDKGYRTTSEVSSLLNYVTEEVNLEDGIEANEITIPHSTLQTVRYVYDEEEKVYTRYARGRLQSDLTTGDELTTKNIIIEFIDNYTLNDGTSKGRQAISNIGTYDGYYITNGQAIKIKCTKTARNSRTKYEDEEGNTIDVNDGNTWINICPENADVTIE